MRSLRNAWQCAVSHVFHVSGSAVQFNEFICSVTDNNSSLDIVITNKRIKFLDNLLSSRHVILHTLYMHVGRHESLCLKDSKLHCVC